MIIKNGRVFQEDGTFAEKDLYIEGKRFVSTKEEVIDQEVIDAKGMMVLPGLVDVHSHGAAGHDFSDGDVEGLKEILRYEKAHGITSYCPTSMTLPKDDLLKIFGTIEAIKDEPEAEVIAGVNMEGPFIDPIKKGAQAEENIVAPNAEFFRACNAASGGKIRLVTLELICDGYHIHGAVVRATFSMMGSERMVLISDSMMATGMPNGTYSLGGQAVWMKDGKATLTDGETIAGSATNLYDCMRKAVSFDIPLADAIFAATRNPAQSIGIYDEVGSIAPGKKAHVLLVDDELNLKQVIM